MLFVWLMELNYTCQHNSSNSNSSEESKLNKPPTGVERSVTLCEVGCDVENDENIRLTTIMRQSFKVKILLLSLYFECYL